MMRVLIVDDHDSFRASARSLLEAEGFTVVGEAASGLEAIELIASLEPEVVLLDIQLPDIDGIEVARRVAQAGRPPVLILTSSRDARDYGRRLKSASANGFISKAELSAMRIIELVGTPDER